MRAAALPPLPADFPIRAIAPGAIGRQSGEDIVNRSLGPEPGRQPGKPVGAVAVADPTTDAENHERELGQANRRLHAGN